MPVIGYLSPGSPAPLSVQIAGFRKDLKLHVWRASTEQDIDAAVATLVQLRADALLVASDAFLSSRIEQIVGLAARHAVPAIYEGR
jgi:putative tryptophan/tyrosine transport system substrate-binding protein